MKVINKIIIVIFLLLLFSIAITNVKEFGDYANEYIDKHIQQKNEGISENEEIEYYSVYKYEKIAKEFNNYDQALLYAKSQIKSYITKKDENTWLWDNFDKYIVFSQETYINDYSSFEEAYANSKILKYGIIYYEDTNNLIWKRNNTVRNEVKLDIKVVNQYPELPRGCEVTSLSMLLSSQNINVDKMTLAKEVVKNNEKHEKIDVNIIMGNPNKGFVGNMYRLGEYGYGVYHKPIYELFKKYSGDNAVDISGLEFDDFYYFIDSGSPVWVITNTTFKKLGENNYNIINIDGEELIVTYKEHSVIVTGYDNENIYINDPLKYSQNIKLNKHDFIEAWEQMGRQAITYIKPTK